jgi:hypothetical protein
MHFKTRARPGSAVLVVAILGAWACDDSLGPGIHRGGDASTVGSDADPSSGDAGAGDAGGCWTDMVDPGPADCRDKVEITTDRCLAATFPPFGDDRLNAFESVYTAAHGAPVTAAVLVPGQELGFYLDRSGVFLTVVHAFQSCLADKKITQEYMAGTDGPPIVCGGFELLWVGAAATVFKDPTSATYKCFDCLDVSMLADVAVGRIGKASDVPAGIATLPLADTTPATGSNVLLLGKPSAADITPGEARVSFGTMQGTSGTAAAISNYAIPGFSAGPIFDSCGNVFAAAVTRVIDVIGAEPKEWDVTWTIGVTLAPYRPKIDAALAYARANPVP